MDAYCEGKLTIYSSKTDELGAKAVDENDLQCGFTVITNFSCYSGYEGDFEYSFKAGAEVGLKYHYSKTHGWSSEMTQLLD